MRQGFWMMVSRILFLGLLCFTALAQASSAVAAESGGQMRVELIAVQQSALSAELAAKVARLPFKEGESFKAGDLLIAFDCALYRAQSDKAQAQADQAEQTLKVSERLSALNSISKLELEQAQGKVKETRAEAEVMSVTVEKCQLFAPFSGRVSGVHVEVHQFVTQGKPLLDIIDPTRLEVRMIVPSRWLSWLTKGSRFNVHVEDLGRNYAAHVTRVGARVDPVSQTVSVAGEIEGAPQELLPGMSGTVTFKLNK
jgi:RND family efflux transporter MFP subunit